MSISDRREQAERLVQLHNDRLRQEVNPQNISALARAMAKVDQRRSTFVGRTETDDRGGRFAALHKPQIIGSSPDANYPTLPFNPFQNDQAAEPTIDGTECASVCDGTLTRSHPDDDCMSALPPLSHSAQSEEVAPLRLRRLLDL